MKQFTIAELFEYKINDLHNQSGITIADYPEYFDHLEVIIDRLKVFEKLQHELTWHSAKLSEQTFQQFYKENFF